MKNLLILLALLIASPAWAQPTAEIIKEKTRYGEISYPQLSGIADKNIEDSINKIIKEEAASWTCDFDDGPGPDPEGTSYDAWSEVRLIDENHFSYTISKDNYCGGNHPNNYMQGRNYDLKTGAPETINGLFTPERTEENLTNYLVENHKFDEGGCGKEAYKDGDFTHHDWDFYRLTDKIVFMPVLAHAVQACYEEFPISLEDLKPYMWAEMDEDRD